MRLNLRRGGFYNVGSSGRSHGAPRDLRGACARHNRWNCLNSSHGNFANNVTARGIYGLKYFFHVSIISEGVDHSFGAH
jgi:hypothetical protein